MKRLCLLVAMLPVAGSLWAQTALVSQFSIMVGKSQVIEVPEGVERVAVGSGDVLEAIAISATEVMLNAKALGETSVLVWPRSGRRREYDVRVVPSPARIEKIRRELHREVGEGADIEVDNGTIFLRGTVSDLAQADRALAIAGALGKTLNLLRVTTPPADPQILLKIRFADIDRGASTELGFNLFSTGAANTIGSSSTQQFSAPSLASAVGNIGQFNVSDALNLFLFRSDLNLGAAIKALQAKNLIQILAEPNLLAMAGKEASFLAGGEFPYPVVQGGAGVNTVTIQFREFGIRIKFLPTITPRGTIHLQVAPEVSALDYANGLTYQGFTVPGLSVRKVSTEVELENGQSFAIAGLLDNRVTESLSKVPGLSSIPFLGKLFQSRSMSRNNSELLIVVTPEVVRPLSAGTAIPQLAMPQTFLKGGSTATPTASTPDPTPLPAQPTVPVEQLEQSRGGARAAQKGPRSDVGSDPDVVDVLGGRGAGTRQ